MCKALLCLILSDQKRAMGALTLGGNFLQCLCNPNKMQLGCPLLLVHSGLLCTHCLSPVSLSLFASPSLCWMLSPPLSLPLSLAPSSPPSLKSKIPPAQQASCLPSPLWSGAPAPGHPWLSREAPPAALPTPSRSVRVRRSFCDWPSIPPLHLTTPRCPSHLTGNRCRLAHPRPRRCRWNPNRILKDSELQGVRFK